MIYNRKHTHNNKITFGETKKKILFSGHDFKFLQSFIDRCCSVPSYEVRLDEHRAHNPDSIETCHHYLQWADVIFCEWALGNAVWYSQNKLRGQLLIVRLHLQEIRGQDSYLKKINWNAVDKLILISHSTYDWVCQNMPQLTDKACVIYNPIDAGGKLCQPKLPFSEFNLGIVGITPQRKRLDIAIDILKFIKIHDERFNLHIKGKLPIEYPWMLNQHEELSWYYQTFTQINSLPFRNSIIFDQHGSNMPEWYSQIGFILSTSDFEGSHQAVAEGMAAGCIPIIRDWEGASRIYPAQYVFSTPEEAANRILQIKFSDNFIVESKYCQEYARRHFDEEKICNQLDNIIRKHFLVDSIEFSHVPETEVPVIMVICHLSAGQYNGYRIRIEQEIYHLKNLGYTIHLACFFSPSDNNEKEQLIQELLPLGCRVHLFKTNHFFSLVSEKRFNKEIQYPLEQVIREHNIEVIHAEALYSARIAISLKPHRPECSIVFDCHGISPEEEKMGGASKKRVQLLEKWEKKILKASDLTIFVSNAMRNHYINKYNLYNIPSIILPCCIDSRSSLTNTDLKTELDELEDNRFIMAYAGSLAAWQCSMEMILLFSQLYARNNNLFLLLLCPGKDHSEAIKQLANLKIPKTSFLLKEVPHNQVIKYLEKSDIGILLREKSDVNKVSSPTKFGEYLSAGLPVMLTDTIGDYSREVKINKLGIILNSEDIVKNPLPDHIFLKIEEYFDYIRSSKQSINNKCKIYANSLKWDNHISTLARSYKKIVRNNT